MSQALSYMKHSCQKICSLTTFVALILSLSGFVISQSSDRRNVLDYYQLIGQSSEDAKPDPSEKLSVRDLKNGFLQYDTDYYQKQVVLFRKSDRSALVLVGVTTGGVASTDLKAYELCVSCSDARMTDVTSEVIPKLSGRQYRNMLNKKLDPEHRTNNAAIAYELPRKGKTIKVLGSNEHRQDIELFNLVFYADHFEIAE